MKDKLKKAGVIGYPIEHSLSPKLHKYWLDKYKINGDYQKIAIEPDNLKTGINELIKEDFVGFNVTIPHKQAIIKYLDEIDETAQKIGAVNTVIIDKNKKLSGFNTDSFGFWQNLTNNLNDKKINSAILIGAGGAARASLFAMLDNNIKEIYLINRTLEKANNLKNDFQAPNVITANFADIPHILKKQKIDLIVNSTSLGMKNSSDFDFDLFENLQANTIVYDLVYNPLATSLLKFAKTKNCPTIDGLGMLIHQAVLAFKKFFGKLPKADKTLRKILLEHLQAK